MSVTLGMLPMWAAPVDEAAAAQCASQFLGQQAYSGRIKAAPQASALRLARVELGKQGMPVYYLFNTDDSFVIVAGDDRAAPVLGYGDNPLDPEAMPCNLQGLLSVYKSQIEWLQVHPDARAPGRAPASTTVVEPLLSCTWSQSAPYYDLCPMVKGKHCVTGCIATAMAQVMYYWHYPSELPDLHSYITGYYHIPVPALPVTTVQWDDMLDGYSMPYTEAQGLSVATLMRYCGQATSMEYGTDGSGSGSWNQLSGLLLFGYNQTTRLLHRDDYETDEWNAMMLEDLSLGRPILYTGSGEGGGHAYVVDGYDGYMYHINWGWEGSWNGYFMLDAFDVGDMSFSWGQTMLYRLHPGEDVPVYDIDVDGVCYKLNGSEATVTTRERSYGSYRGAVVIPDVVTSGGVTYRVTAIGNDAFKNCSRLVSVTLPSTLKRIGKYAFKNCSALRSIIIPDNVTEIGDLAFLNCSAMTSVTLGRKLESIGYYAFYGCSAIRRLDVPSSVKFIDEAAFKYCYRMNQLTIGNGLEQIGDEAFASCWSLRQAVIGNKLKVISTDLFFGCVSLEDVTLGKLVDSIAPGAFTECTSLRTLKMLPLMPPVVANEECFPEQSYSQTSLIVPSASFEDYYCTDVWTLFDNIICFDDVAVNGDVNGDGEVNIADVNAVIDAILSGMGEAESFDVNGDGEVNIADVNAVVDIILSH